MSQSAEKKPRLWNIVQFLKRFVALACVVASVYVAIGSIAFGSWWFGFFWDAKGRDFDYILGGLQFLVESHPYSLITIVGVTFVLALIARSWKGKVLSIVDQFWIWLSAGGIVALFVTSVLVYHNCKSEYEQSIKLTGFTAKWES